MAVNWFPNHMRSSEAVLRQNLKYVDVIFEVLDARIPFSSRDPRIDTVIKQKPRIVILNKCDLSDRDADKEWISYFAKEGFKALRLNGYQGSGVKQLITVARRVALARKSGFNTLKNQKRAISAMVVGIPNVGKSTIINAVAGRKKAKIANKPGVTRTKQRVTTPKGLEFLDTPGILWPREDEATFERLAIVGAVKDEILDLETLALSVVKWLIKRVPENLADQYGIEWMGKDGLDILKDIAMKRGCIQKSQKIDVMRVSRLVLGDFRKGRLGRITLELPNEPS